MIIKLNPALQESLLWRISVCCPMQKLAPSPGTGPKYPGSLSETMLFSMRCSPSCPEGRIRWTPSPTWWRLRTTWWWSHCRPQEPGERGTLPQLTSVRLCSGEVPRIAAASVWLPAVMETSLSTGGSRLIWRGKRSWSSLNKSGRARPKC